MSIEALDRLREAIERDVNNPWSNLKGNLLVLCDKVEQEVEGRYMPLPLDMDGVPIRAGDLVEVVGMEDGKAVTIACDERGRWSVAVKPHHWDTPTVYSADELRHVNPRTIEDVLTDLCNEVAMQGHQIGLTGHEIVMKYADELRELMEVE